MCYADIEEFSGTLDSEIEKVVLLEELPDNWTYPLIQPKLIEKVVECKLKIINCERVCHREALRKEVLPLAFVVDRND